MRGCADRPAFAGLGDIGHRLFGEDFDAMLIGQVEETIENGLGIIAHGKYAAVRFGFERDPPFFKPGYHVSRHEMVKGAQQFLLTPRVVSREFGRNVFGEGYVATATTGHLDFGQDLLAAFQYRYPEPGIHFCRIDGSEKTGSTAADHYNVKIQIWHFL